MTPEDVNWRFLVPLLDLSFPVFKSLITAINHSNKSPRSRMQRFLNYVRGTFDVIETTHHIGTQLSYRLEFNDFLVRCWLWQTYYQVSICVPRKFSRNYESSYSQLSWRAYERIKTQEFLVFYGNADYPGIDVHETDYFDLFYQLTSENPT